MKKMIIGVAVLILSVVTSSFVEANDTDGITYTDGQDVYKLSPLTGTPEKLTNYTNGTIGNQRVSPSREKIAYTYNDGNGYGIYIVDATGGTATEIAAIATNAGRGYYSSYVCWAPSSQQVAYNDGNTLYKVNIDGTGLSQLATAPTGRYFQGCDWSLSGNKIVTLTKGSWAYNSEIYIMDSDGNNMTQIVSDEPGDMQPPAISPDGSKVIYSYDIEGYERSSGGSLDMRLYLINSDGTGITDMSTGKTTGTHDSNPKWSSDGTKILFVNAPWPSAGTAYIYQVDVDGSNRTQMTAGYSPDFFDASDSCSSSTGYTQAELDAAEDAAYSSGYSAGYSANNGGNSTGSPATVGANLGIHIPSATFGSSNIWVDLEYNGTSGFDHLWKLSDYGYNQ